MRPAVTTTGTRATRVIGALALIGLGWLLLFGLVLSPPDQNQGEAKDHESAHENPPPQCNQLSAN